uniref:Uncharacterized protein n=1 Tax=Ananas comosus var. bracteatus TaxID=296719 RepID=A0A6V7Q9J7_ANACO|nr:unnamed protein product [Ananas comosus var. bracteatus]
MQVPGATDLASKSHSSSDFNPLRPKDEIDDSYQLNGKVRCLCGGTIMTESVLQETKKNLTAEELLPSLWEKCKKEFLDKYGSFLKLVAKIYPNETVSSVAEMRELLSTM